MVSLQFKDTSESGLRPYVKGTGKATKQQVTWSQTTGIKFPLDMRNLPKKRFKFYDKEDSDEAKAYCTSWELTILVWVSYQER